MEQIKKFWEIIKTYASKFWAWFGPYWSRFRTWRKRVWKKYHINKIIILVMMSVILVTSIYLFYLAKNTNVSSLQSGLQQVTTIYDKDGDEAGTLAQYGSKGSFVKIDEISPFVKDAVISTEDRSFYEHKGYSIKGIARAAVRKVVRRNNSGGGGSTITQQLAKNAFLSQEQTMTRKAKELFLAIEMEKEYTKDEILEMYLNKSYFGNGVWGIQDASKKYFGKDAKDVTIDEAAVLAGMLKGPSIYNPIDSMENAIARRDTVLSVMVDNGKLDKAEADNLMKQPLHISDSYVPQHDTYKYPYYFDSVIAEAIEKTKLKDEEISNGGYKIFTTLDQQYQIGMDQTFANDSLFPPAASDGAIVEGATIALNPKTGGVMGIIGGRGEYTYRGFNRATDSMLSPGSTLKPISVYTPALEAGYKPDDVLKDEALSYYDVQNYSRTYAGEATMTQSLIQSLNAPAVWLLNEIGVDQGFKKTEQFGIKLDEKDRYHGLALGGLTKGTTPLNMASAYSVFANQGNKVEPHFISKIEDANGVIIYENEKPKSKRVTTPEVADEMTSMLQGVFSSGTGMEAKPAGYTIAGKTGTTENINADGMSKDQWIIGYTPDVVVSTWIGFDKSGKDHYLTGSSGSNLSNIFRDETQRILAASPNTPFSVGDVTQGESEEEDSKSGITDSINDIGDKVKEGANTLGDGIKKGVDKAGDIWNSIWNKVGQ
ncbi:PBP1A family penicillin-binding protein [Vagococcus carniphilus]|uniref:PBP1A family penicillin-binding protein n=1 Tax=Vagococcus carniphilus TaxID=218144 RepID=A0AAW8U2S8_9ENTE|nr:PBP1A family penicillin-binding protein [Vagococcus carniphilus]MDT2830200.1 PBP1A family penicillin-binding protein [Vagococcus carniphilus]MDT2833885.1 PBP1A family penicillin-binding protein [Vagococcus carniphilus]MDT2838632.1 PBP1A family penicillin-binding protein [Vagococcus carniphilus]MDT2848233.1 PBP1A family penicillin-binding protein [Vagococcus carniphilus]MDT2853470.1 PBP1A family penicillin-binding protein [Vagococcus carniphilus]